MGPSVDTAQSGIGRTLVSAGLVTESQLKDAAAVQSDNGDGLVHVLLAEGALDSRRFVEFLSQPGRSQIIGLGDFVIAPEIIRLVPSDVAVMNKLVPVEREGTLLTVACAGPLEAPVVDALTEHTGLTIKPLICPADDVNRSVAWHYKGALGGAAGLTNVEGPLKLNMAVSMLRRIESLPALPRTVSKVREIAYESGASVSNVAEAISEDAAISAKVLRVANSAAYGFSHKVESVQLAVSLLGLVETYSIVVSSAVINMFDRSRTFDYMAFWLESQMCARAARALAKFLELKNHSGVFAAGLLHDIGRVALVQIVPKQYERVSPTLTGLDLVRAEGEILGLAHTEAGYELAQHWGLPADLAECIRFHHTSQYACEQHRDIVSIVNIAEAIARAQPKPGEALEIDLSECEAALRVLDLKETDIAEVAASVQRPSATDTLWSPA